jgi:hypothetical protein
LSDENDCGPTTKHHVLAGKTFGFDKEKGREHRFVVVEGNNKKMLRVASR